MDDSSKSSSAPLSELGNSLADVICCIQGHELAGCYDIYRLCIPFSYGNSKPAADDISEDIVDDDVPFFLEETQFFEHLNHREDAPSRTADPWLRTSCFNAGNTSKALEYKIVQLIILCIAPVSENSEHGWYPPADHISG